MMKNYRTTKISNRNIVAVFAAVLALTVFPLDASAKIDTQDSPSAISVISSADIEALPISQAIVNGDKNQFRAHNWRSDGYEGGIERFTMRGGTEDGLTYEGSGSALVAQNEFEGEFRIEKENLGYLLFEYEEFRKYYDVTGGVYRPFLEDAPFLDRELYLDIGHFAVELGLTPEDMPHVFFRYEREYINGSKSRLTWGEREENNVTRNITPSWQELDESVDKFELREEYTYRGFEIRGEQDWEFVHIKSRRWEFDTSPSTSAGDNKIRVQDQEPETSVFTNTLKVAKWFKDNKVFGSFGYQFMHVNNKEQESLLEFDDQLNPRAFGFAESQPYNYGENALDQHSFVFNVSVQPVQWFQTIFKIKGDLLDRGGSSMQTEDTTDPPDGFIDSIQYSDTDNTTKTLAESISLRFKAIPRTAVYVDAELEQTVDYLSEMRVSAQSAGENLERETHTDTNRGSFTVGFNIQPVRAVNFSNQFRYRRTNNDYNHERETNPGATAFYDSINYQTAEFTSRISVRPCHWFQTSLRYMVQDTDFFSRYDSQNVVKIAQNSSSISFDVTLIPIPELFITNSFTHSTSSVGNSVIRSNSSIEIPTFNSDYNTWMSSVDYHPTEKVSVTSALYYSMADNFNDLTPSQVSFAAGYDQVGLRNKVEVQISKNVDVALTYDYQNYTPDSRYKSTDYSAHIIGGRVHAAFG